MIHVRPMTAEDFERFWPTFQAIVQARETYAFDPELSIDQARQLWLELPQHTLLAEEDGELLALIILRPMPPGLARTWAIAAIWCANRHAAEVWHA